MFDVIRRLFSDRRSDELIALTDAHDHHVADLRAQLELEQSRHNELLNHIMGKDKPSFAPELVGVGQPPRRNWRDVQKRLEEKDKEYAESKREDSAVMLGAKSAKQDKVG